jgi:hypothetical protein
MELYRIRNNYALLKTRMNKTRASFFAESLVYKALTSDVFVWAPPPQTHTLFLSFSASAYAT